MDGLDNVFATILNAHSPVTSTVQNGSMRRKMELSCLSLLSFALSLQPRVSPSTNSQFLLCSTYSTVVNFCVVSLFPQRYIQT